MKRQRRPAQVAVGLPPSAKQLNSRKTTDRPASRRLLSMKDVKMKISMIAFMVAAGYLAPAFAENCDKGSPRFGTLISVGAD